MNTLPMSDFRPDNVRYSLDTTTYTHNFEHDYQIALLRTNESVVNMPPVGTPFSLVAEYDLIWTRKHLKNNLRRLGITHDTLTAHLDQDDEVCLKALVFLIDSPEYQLTSTGAFRQEWTSLVPGQLFDNAILVSDNIESFFYSATLLLGPECVDDLVCSKSRQRPLTDRSDLAGAAGWDSFDQMFRVANACSDWVVLRNSEFLPDDFWNNDKDIDILCADLERYVSAVNATRRGAGISSFEVLVESRKVDLDARFLGDGYYDRRWQSNMLACRTLDGVVPVLSLDDYFFSLLYHARIHKSVVKANYVPRLARMADSLGYALDEDVFVDDEICARFLDSYLERNGYKFTNPSDYACYDNINRNVTRRLKNVKRMPFDWGFTMRLVKRRIIAGVRSVLPTRLETSVRRVLGK